MDKIFRDKTPSHLFEDILELANRSLCRNLPSLARTREP